MRGQTRQVLLASIERQIARTLSPEQDHIEASPLTHLMWFLDGAALFFLISWTGTTLLWLDNDFYYAVYIWIGLTFFWLYVRLTGSEVLAWFHRRWRLSLTLGVLSGIYVVTIVWQARMTGGPSGWLLTFEVLWRGLIYGVVDSVVMTAFPVAVALGIMRGNVEGLGRRIGFGLLTMTLVWSLSAAYNIGFRQFNEDDVVRPQVTRTAIALPAVISTNPLGSIAAQAAMNITATLRTYESWEFVPPHVEHIRDYEPPGVFGPR